MLAWVSMSSGGIRCGGGGARVDVAVAAKSVAVMLIRQSRAPSGSRAPVRSGCPAESETMILCRSRKMVQLASHSFPRLSKLFLNCGIMWPDRAWAVGMQGRSSCAAAMEVQRSPVAVWVVVGGACGFVLSSGAEGMK